MSPFGPFRLPDRQAVLHFLKTLQPKAGRIIGALGGMILAGPAWLYGFCVGILLGAMVDSIRAKIQTGFLDSDPEDPRNETSGKAASDKDSSDTQSGSLSPGPLAEDPYRVLGLQPGASMTEVKKAWRRRSRQAHPDTPGGAAEDFMALKKAYEQIIEQHRPEAAKP